MINGLLRFLRYNTRHHLYLGAKGLELNPISYSSHHNGKRTKTWHEPLWLFRLRQQRFAFAGRQRCGRRDDPFSFNRGDAPQPDTWRWGPDGNRTCSYCGSLHPDDFVKICRLVPGDERYAVSGTDKGYKFYVTQPGVRNASEGGIKFYMQHAPKKEPTEGEQAAFSAALRISRERWNAKWMRKP